MIAITNTQNSDHSKTERYIKESESAWAEAGSKGDTATIERILSDDFVGVAPDGSFYDKAKEIVNTREEQGNVLSNHTNEIKVRFFGNETAVAQGSETWENRTGDSEAWHIRLDRHLDPAQRQMANRRRGRSNRSSNVE